MGLLPELDEFLLCETPDTWVAAALNNQDILLIDHANCEKKAAATALNLMFRYIEHTDLQNKMSRLAREELRHFEQVFAIMQQRGVDYRYVSASRYATTLRDHVRKQEPLRLVDTLIVGAFIEARSCERFSKLAPYLDDELAKFYRSLLKSEARHFQDYLILAMNVSEGSITSRVADIAEIECEAILRVDPEFRFHSGVPVKATEEAAGVQVLETV
ncbi:tRNA-(ms[2]io[6]A)-hydroxylase [Kistimonas asteriae]|uniref:tRNA-(ms[2]io[6]A)-hydroxylase n=1 Tax=Kistimonas asteriae TaxID=517724 RepID=UPI001BAD777D|nr:tRNA isopentenyl-2-thiomethyl-A-37 hydroxylase MiaE [Kistimonas asteriae]